MQRRQLWSLIVVVVVAVFALIIALPIDHPSWFDSIQFWNPEGTRQCGAKAGVGPQRRPAGSTRVELGCHERQHGRRQKGRGKPRERTGRK